MAQFIVTVAEDVSDGDLGADDLSLREAIELANATAAPDTITFAPDVGTITLQDALPTITADLVLRGGRSVTIDANAGSEERRGLDIDGAGAVTIDGLTITGGKVNGIGGGIRANDVGNLQLVNATISGNTAEQGGGLGALGATSVRFTDSVVSHNTADWDGVTYAYYGEGGGIYSAREITLVRTEVSSNSAYYGGGISSVGDVTLTQCSVISNIGASLFLGGGGGGVYSEGTVSVIGGQISHNAAYGAGGGILANKAVIQNAVLRDNSASAALYHSPPAHGGGVSANIVQLTNSEISDNIASGNYAYGGGIFAGQAIVVNSTIADNEASGIFVTGEGGGIFAGTVTVTSSTISGNRANGYAFYGGGGSGGSSGSGGGIHGKTIVVSNSLILGNASDGAADDIGGRIRSDGLSLIGGDGREVFAETIRVAPGVFAGELAMNGGPTGTVALLEGGLAVGAGDPATASARDQRGVARDAAPDLGALELRGPQLTIAGGPAGERLVGRDGSDRLDGDGGNDELFGYLGRDSLLGGNGHDDLFGGGGDDRLFGNAGRDRLFGDSGDDRLSGGAGRDVLSGQSGDDVLFGRWGDDTLYGGEGRDTLQGDTGSDRLLGNHGTDLLSGGAGRDTLSGQAGDDQLFGDAGSDRLLGGDGDDLLAGGWAADVLSGDGGSDTLSGGRDADTFVLANQFDSMPGLGTDRIVDFEHGVDKIDLRGIDADAGESGDQAFTFVGNVGLGRTPGTVDYVVSGGNTIVRGSTDTDTDAEFSVELVGIVALSADDFYL